ncbi:MAG TPA: hypothetical protein DCZ92_09250 [Elusimicrobia bacterium]|nr:MAG: hypothetical protein A2016_05775 [Elusimicrobia bacterium GWF2_62_30]HBA60989.1 hypothetical protein [Elusimicrobiota bacterium]
MKIMEGTVAAKVCAAMPVWLLIADKDMRIIYRNKAAINLLGRGKVYKTRLGEALNCINSTEGCGLSHECGHCPVRNSAKKVFKGGAVERSRVTVSVADKRMKTTREVPMLLTASPIKLLGKELCLLALEDISEITELRAILPICASCKKIRNGKDYWERVETYIHNHIADVEFSNGLCPECFSKAYKDGKPPEIN